MRPYVALRIYRVSRRSRYHGLTQIHSYSLTLGAPRRLTWDIGCCLRCRTLPCSATHTYLFVAEHSFWYRLVFRET